MAWVRQYSAPNVVGARKLKALIFYTINPLLDEKLSLCVIEPLFGDLWAMYAVHLRLNGKPIVDFLLVIIIELFSLGAMVQALQANIDWKSPFQGGGSLWPKISGTRGHPHPTICARIDMPVNALQLCR